MKIAALILSALGLAACTVAPRATPTASIDQGVAMNFVKSYPATPEQAKRFADLDFQYTPSYLPSMDATTTYLLNLTPSRGAYYFSLPGKPINFGLNPADQKKFEQLIAEILPPRKR